ncbi:flagellar hook-basal body complex protein FliE [Clostridium intestinale]|uniref:Flagellar hook-basal body complex protein FliE n=1 Tax=Clostridium intestinale DSM 6191 TaxID=1121320 RepID=A0A1M5XZS5_9CLOT|nr:flagellar hook-basal body complex protein FliE [Clostridium intestinale]SHI05216.1 flagellar hook-basal body complex protein FliE [Clostridium intestinale DSM 6191]
MKINSFIPNEQIFNTSNESKNNKISEAGGSDFFKILKDKLNEVNEQQVNADEMTTKMIQGEDVEVHDVMLAAAEAQTSLQLAVQVRNKIVEAIQEINRMQI